MSRYTLRVSGEPIDAAAAVLGVTGGVSSTSAADDALILSVDAPTLAEARRLVEAALPEHGTYAIARPEALEDDPDD